MSSNGNVLIQKGGKFYINGVLVESKDGKYYHNPETTKMGWFLAGFLLGAALLIAYVYNHTCGVAA